MPTEYPFFSVKAIHRAKRNRNNDENLLHTENNFRKVTVPIVLNIIFLRHVPQKVGI